MAVPVRFSECPTIAITLRRNLNTAAPAEIYRLTCQMSAIGVTPPKWHCEPLGHHHDFSSCLVLLHAAMRLNDLIQVEGPAHLNVQRARHDLLDQALERRSHEVFRFPGIVGEADRGGDRLHRREIVDRPFATPNPPPANHPAPLLPTPRCFP